MQNYVPFDKIFSLSLLRGGGGAERAVDEDKTQQRADRVCKEEKERRERDAPRSDEGKQGKEHVFRHIREGEKGAGKECEDGNGDVGSLRQRMTERGERHQKEQFERRPGEKDEGKFQIEDGLRAQKGVDGGEDILRAHPEERDEIDGGKEQKDRGDEDPSPEEQETVARKEMRCDLPARNDGTGGVGRFGIGRDGLG